MEQTNEINKKNIHFCFMSPEMERILSKKIEIRIFDKNKDDLAKQKAFENSLNPDNYFK
jgi:hypothetical protein